MIQPDSHGIVQVFADRLHANLQFLDPEMAAREAMAAVDGFLRASKFIDASSKGSAERAYIRVNKRPEEVRK